tara:strand:- start:1708 stop:2007 length:300 start_codon:yes stop_codon:yes gene_type:complete
MRQITVADFVSAKPSDPTYILTFAGAERVQYVRNPTTDPWVVCNNTNSFLNQSSFCVHMGTALYVADEGESLAKMDEYAAMDQRRTASKIEALNARLGA